MFDKDAKELKANTMVMEGTFTKCKMKLLQFTFQPYANINGDSSDADCYLLVEVEGEPLDKDVEIKVNLYNAEGEIFYMDECYICADEFGGYDTLKMELMMDCDTLRVAKSAKIYAK